jgi:hypothetical protein
MKEGNLINAIPTLLIGDVAQLSILEMNPGSEGLDRTLNIKAPSSRKWLQSMSGRIEER